MADTKIIITVGPASSSDDVLYKILKLGISTIRINTAHADIDEIKKIKAKVEDYNKKNRDFVSILVDLKGPELRTIDTENYNVVQGKNYILSGKRIDENTIKINNMAIVKNIQENDLILMSDGKISFKVLKIFDDRIQVIALNNGILRNRARINVPGRILDLGVLTERDMEFLKEGIKNDVDFFALSFVQNKKNVETLHKIIMENNGNQGIVSKIETKSGLENLVDIIKVSDSIMVARGDLGVELPLEEVSIAQKNIIKEAHKFGIPTIVATQMLESMIKESTPTRAEVSDVTNAILDNADAVMLSEETAIGSYPVEAVNTLVKIINYVESTVKDFEEPEEFLGNKVAFSIAKASKVIARNIEADAILGFTISGNTAKMLSAVRPGIPIYIATPSENVARKINTLRGIRPFIIEKNMGINEGLEILKNEFKIKNGARIVVTSGSPYFQLGGTNNVMVMVIGEVLGRGYAISGSFSGKVSATGGNGNILICKNQVKDIDPNFKKFNGIIFTEKVSLDVIDYLIENKINALINTKMVKFPKEDDLLYVDSLTGIIIK